MAGAAAAGRCLDYRASPEVDGIRVSGGANQWMLEFTGRQPDEADLLWRPAAGLAREPIPSDSRLAWVTRMVHGVPREVLVYRRDAGQVPLRGSFVLGRDTERGAGS